MRVGVGLPSTIQGTKGQLMMEWACRANEGPFSSLGVLDRLSYDSYEPLISLATAAAVTYRVTLATTIVIGPLRNNALLAKTVSSLDALSNGRLVLGLSVGARKEDYDFAGINYRGRGKRFSGQPSSLRSIGREGSIARRRI